MDRLQPEEQTDARKDLRQARARLDELVRALRQVDVELEALAVEQARFALLTKASDALYELETLGAGSLFWTTQNGASLPSDHLRVVRGRIDEFEKQHALVEERRHSLLEEIDQEQDRADTFAGFVLDAERLAEEAANEWLIVRDPGELPVHTTVMPWSGGQEDDRRFRRTLATALLLCLLLSIALPFIEIPVPDHWEMLEEQERLTQLVREELKLSEPPPAVVEPKSIDPVVPKEMDHTVPEASDEPAPILADKAQTESNPAPAANANTGSASGAGAGAGSRGLMAFRERLSGIAASNEAVDRLGSNALVHDPTATMDGLPTRSLVTSNAPGTSGGINVAALSRGTGGGQGNQLSGFAVTQATSSIGSGNGNGTGNGTGTGNGSGRGGARSVAGGGATMGRTDEEIQIVFDRHKAALYRLYNRELRQNPTLKGQMVLRLTIQPDGSVSFCEVKSTDMKAPELARQVVERVRGFDFGAKPGIPAVTIIYPIDFLPAT